MFHTSFTLNWVVFLLPRRQTRSAIYGRQIFEVGGGGESAGVIIARQFPGGRVVGCQHW